MNFIQKSQEENTPYVQLLMLVFYAVIGIFLSILLGFVLILLKYGMVIFSDLSWLNGTDTKYIGAMRILISAQQIGLFVVPAFFLAVTEKRKQSAFYGFSKPIISNLVLVLLLMIVSMPFLEWITLINQKMVLPDAFKALEQWMKNAEESAMATTIALLKMDNIGTYLINIAMIALLPAFAEEYLFRGALLRTFNRMFKNPHWAIWITAFLFSAIHMQFYGFLPRFLLGAGFGYLYWWTGSIWYAMFAHFLNNAYAVTAAWYMQKNNIPLSEVDKTANFQWYGYIISLVLTITLFWFFKCKTTLKE